MSFQNTFILYSLISFLNYTERSLWLWFFSLWLKLLCFITVHGVWEEWSPWSLCSFTCGRGQRTRTRSCTPPQYGGRPCEGPETHHKPCNIALCPGKHSWFLLKLALIYFMYCTWCTWHMESIQLLSSLAEKNVFSNYCLLCGWNGVFFLVLVFVVIYIFLSGTDSSSSFLNFFMCIL